MGLTNANLAFYGPHHRVGVECNGVGHGARSCTPFTPGAGCQ
jgi:hypothetical protein